MKIILAMVFLCSVFVGNAQHKWKEVIKLPKHFRKLAQNQSQQILDTTIVPYGKHKRQYILHLQATEHVEKKNAAVIFFHGGAWHVGKPELNLYLAKILTNAGYEVFMPAYRLGPNYSFYGIQADVDSAMVHCMKRLSANGQGNYSLIIGGASAGANLAALLAYNQNRLEQLAINPKQIKGCFSFAGVLDMNFMQKTKVLKKYAGKISSSQFDAANAYNYIDAKDEMPFLCLHGTLDGIVPLAVANSFCKKIEDLNVTTVEKYVFPKANHIDISSKWYYSATAYYGQDEILLNWIQKQLNTKKSPM